MTSWIDNKKAQMAATRQLEKALLNKPEMRVALNRYVESLDLQGQINRGNITEQQAAALFQRAIQQFSYAINNDITQRFTPAFMDQHDLNIPLNMQQALDNPNSFASQQLNDLAAAVIVSISDESAINEQTLNQQQMNDEQITQIQAQTQQEEPTPTPEPASHEKEEILVAAVIAVSLEDKAVKETIEKIVEKDFSKEEKELGNTLEKDFGKEEKKFKGTFEEYFGKEKKESGDEFKKIEEKEESLFKIPTPKPPTPREDK